MNHAALRIGQLSRLSGASPKALRLYEELGLLPPLRRQGSYRSYERAHVEAVLLIRQAQALGFKLKELQALAAQHPLVEAVGLGHALQAVRKKRSELEDQLATLQSRAAMLAHLEAHLQDAHQVACECAQVPVGRAQKS